MVVKGSNIILQTLGQVGITRGVTKVIYKHILALRMNFQLTEEERGNCMVRGNQRP